MIPSIIAFVPKHPGTVSLKRQLEQTSTTPTATVNVTTIAYQGREHPGTGYDSITRHIWRFTVASVATDKWDVSMDCTVAGSATLNGTYKIKAIDFTNNTIDLLIQNPNLDLIQDATGVTIAPTGIMDFNNTVEPDLILRNNNLDEMAYQYTITAAAGPVTTSHYFLTKIDNDFDHRQKIITVTNTHATAALDDISVTWSPDGLHFFDFPNALSDTSLAAGASAAYIDTHHFRGVYVLVTVTKEAVEDVTYYVLMN